MNSNMPGAGTLTTCLSSPAITSVLLTILSALVLIGTSQSLNNDATFYLVTADIFKADGWAAAEKIYQRPFYSALIGTVSLLTGTSSLFSGYLLNIALMALLAFSFVTLVKDLGGKPSAQWVAVAIIVTYPTLCGYREYLIRDFGYWAFSLLGLSFLVRLHNSMGWRLLTGWLLFNLLATLFRPEAAIITLIAPLSFIFNKRLGTSERIWATGKVYLILGGALAVTILAGMAIEVDPIGKLLQATFAGYISVVETIVSQLTIMHDNLVTHVLSRHARSFGTQSAVLILSGIFVAKALKAISLPLILLATLLLWRKALVLPRHPAYVITLSTALIVVVVFFLQKQFLQTRYLLLVSLLLLIPLCFGVGQIINSEVDRTTKITLGILSVILLLDSHVSFGHSKKHTADSIRWLQANIEKGAWLYSNEQQLAYLGGGNFYLPHIRHAAAFNVKLPLKTMNGYDYLAFNLKRRDKALEEFLQALPKQFTKIAEFSNQRSERVIIFSNEGATKIRQRPHWKRIVDRAFENPN